MLQSIGQWIDRHLWALPILIFLIAEVGFIVAHVLRDGAFLLARVDAENRKEIYSSLTGSSSGLLGFALAAVAIMAAFGRRTASTPDEHNRENQLADARVGISKILLATSLLLMIILVTATLAIGVDDSKTGSFALTSIIMSAAISSVIGLLVSCAGLTLSLAERSQQP
ncbi:hypothetical protein [Streptomyces spongiae]|uniref:Uncharacterized protein n=1 Tax=Streptomyces spongiae TaxID=565072 RepID=A0A5N8XQ80_9ACTN|nr:hypothetical protein [Streptomyces spongiae]MPY61519.1 hypothetical protein [Streptomyces spongiae]